MTREYRQRPVDILKEKCDLIDDLIIKYKGYMLLLRKGRGKGSEPADIDLIDYRDKIDADINYVIRKIDRRLRLFDPTDE